MIADFYQGILLMLIFLILMCFLMYKFEWNDDKIELRESVVPAVRNLTPQVKTGIVPSFLNSRGLFPTTRLNVRVKWAWL